MSAAKPENAKPAFRSRLITMLAGAVAVAYALFVFVPGQQSIAGIRRQIRERESQIAKSATLTQPIRELEEKLVTTEKLTKAWRARAPRPHHPSPVFAEVIRHAKETGAEVMSFAPQAEQPLETIGRIPVALQAEGSYRSLHQLLERLEGMSGLIWVDEVHLQPHGKGDERLSCTLKLIIFADRVEISG